MRVGAGNYIALWVLNPGTKQVANLTVLEERWKPWVPRLRQFISGKQS